MTMVSGRVTSPTGDGEAGVYVYAVSGDGGVRFGRAPGTHSDIAGRWSLDLAPGHWTVRETGHTAHELLLGDTAVDLTERGATVQSETPSREDVSALIARRRALRRG